MPQSAERINTIVLLLDEAIIADMLANQCLFTRDVPGN